MDKEGDCHDRLHEEAQPDRSMFCLIEIESSDLAFSKVKRRKMCESDQPESVETTMGCRAQADANLRWDDTRSEDERETERLEVSMFCEIEDSVNDRLCTLQHLIPHGLEFEKDEILKVAVEYVKALEREIQMFDKSMESWCTSAQTDTGKMTDASKVATGAVLQTADGEASVASEVSALQKRGLCVVPLSTLAKAF